MSRFKLYYYRLLAAELRRFSSHFATVKILSRAPSAWDALRDALGSKSTVDVTEPQQLCVDAEDGPVLLLLDGELNHRNDIAEFLRSVHGRVNRTTRVAAVLYNPYLRPIFALADRFGLRDTPLPKTFLTTQALHNLGRASGFELVRIRPVCYVPAAVCGIGTLLNSILPAVPLVRWLSFSAIAVLRPIIPEQQPCSVSLIVPARNEAGNIAPLLDELRIFEGIDTEVVFIENCSKDDTWQVIQRCSKESYPFEITAVQTFAGGKRAAVEAGISAARKQVIAIVDADRTVDAPAVLEHLHAYNRGNGDFINGNRLLYAMEAGAMRFLNLLGNVFFAKFLSYATETQLGDTLCGTKVFARADFERFLAWKHEQAGVSAEGAGDPFGDFDLLLAAASLGLGIVEIPVHYRARRYGTTNISRFSDGWRLLKIARFAFVRLRCAPWV